MSTKTKWSILIPTIGQREERFLRLLNVLYPQVKKYNGQIEILAYWNNGEHPLWKIREDLVKETNGEYVSFIDDDDLVPEYYCDEIMNAIKTSPDYIGWRMQVWHNEEKLKPTFHSLRYSSWTEDDNGFYRNISHLNPIRRDIAIKESFEVEPGIAEDQPWVIKIAPHVKTEVYIDKEMYWYYHTTEDSVWRGDVYKFNRYERPTLRRKYFRWHPNSKKYHIPGEK